MFMNLHTLPAGQSMYTIYVTHDEPTVAAECDEVDVVASKMATPQQVVDAARAELDRDYPDAGVIGVVDQSAGQVIFDGSDTGTVLRWSK